MLTIDKGAIRTWRMIEKCDDCPFMNSGKGLHLRKSLRPGRWRSILAGLRNQEHFYCHKNVEWEDEEEEVVVSGLVCAGSIEWQNKHGVSAQFVRICKRLDAL